MAVTVTDNRTTLDAADATTNFNQGTQNTTDFAEASASVSLAINIGTDQLFFNSTIPDFTTLGNELVYIWSSNTATQNSFDAGASSSHAIWLNDGTNELVILMAGNDRTTFVHAETQVQFQCFLMDVGDYIDEADTASRIFVNAGSVAGFDETGVTEIGSYYVTTSKALAGGFNVFIDAIRYGGRADGLQITGGTTGDRGTFDEIATDDRDKTSGQAFGIIREYTANTFGVQGTLRIGDAVGVTTTYFEDTNQVIVWEDRLVDDDKFALFVDANGTGTNVFILTGCALSSARPGVLVDMTSAGINELTLDGCSFTNLLNAFNLPTDTNGTTLDHNVTDCVYNNVGMVNPASVAFSDNALLNTNAGSDEGALLIDADADTDNWSNLTFVSAGTGHAILITEPGTYDFTNFNYSGYSGTGADATVFNDSGGNVIIGVVGGGTPTVRNGTSATTTVNSNVTVEANGMTEGAAVKFVARETVGTITTGDTLDESLADSAGVASFTINYESAFNPSGLDIVVRAAQHGLPNAAVADDGASLTDETTASNSTTDDDMTLTPDNPQDVNDAYYLGHSEQFVNGPSGTIRFKLEVTVAHTAGEPTIVWEFWDGLAWSALTFTDTDPNPNFGSVGEFIYEFDAEGSWATQTVNGQGPFYYLRARVSSAGTSTLGAAGRFATLDVTKFFRQDLNRTISDTGLETTVPWNVNILAKFDPAND